MSRRIAIPSPQRQPTDRPRRALTARAIATIAGTTLLLSACRHDPPAREDTSPRSGAHAERGARPTPTITDVPIVGNPQLPRRLGFPRVGVTGATVDAASNDVSDAAAPPTSADAAPPRAMRGFLDGNDEVILRRVCDAPIERMERNRGGSTISFRVWFAGGARGLFKPQQRADVANFRAELAAYRLSRLLGLHRVPPACGRRIPRAQMQHIADASGDAQFSERVLHELLGREDTVPGALLHWVPGPLENVPGTDRWQQLLDASQPLAAEDTDLAADLARLVLFDFVTDNVDRWSGGNILRQHLAGQPPSAMLFMDNGASFSVGAQGMGARPHDQAERLAHVQRFPRALVTALRALTVDSVREAMRQDPLGALLGEAQITALLARRDAVLHHVDETMRARGESATMVFP